ncbi:hypothetical protein C0991_011011 [Blastosporella zonata]|nr:hypothetical protein C0991_011011 [Blastosporella zonata]
MKADPRDQSIVIWDTESCGILYNIPPSNSVVDLALSQDGSKLVASFFNQIQVWDLQSQGSLVGGKVKQEAHVGSITPIKFSPDAKKVVSAGEYDRAVKIWECFDGKSLEWESTLDSVQSSLRQPTVVTAMALSSHGTLAIGFQDGNIIFTSADSDENSSQKDNSVSHGDCITDLIFSADGARLVSSSVDQSVRMWNVATGRCISNPLKAEAGVDSISLSPDERKLLVVDRGGNVAVWELQ